MKKKAAVVMIGIVLGLTACGKQAAEAPAEQEVQVAEETKEEAAEAEVTEQAAEAEQEELIEDTVISSDLLTITIPDEFKGKTLAKVDGHEIYVYDKACYEEGFGGFVFSVIVDKDNKVVPGGMYTKVGEYKTVGGQSYNVCRSYPSEVQWDYNKYDSMPEDYASLDAAVDSILKTATANGDGTYMYGAGKNGEDLYAMTIDKYVWALTEGWDADKFEEEGMSPEFYALAKTEGDKAFDKMGYAYMDISSDGVDELLVGVVDDSDEPSVVYDVYTMVNGEPALVASGSARNSFRAMEYGGLGNVFSGGANENGLRVYMIYPDSTELGYQYGVKYDGYTDEKNPWYVNDGTDDEDAWQQTTEDDYNMWNERATEQFLKLDFTPFSELIPIDYSKVDLSKYGTFTEMLKDFKKGMGYANVQLGDTDVFLASSATYIGENDIPNAIDASIFMYNDKGEIEYLGQVQSGGTAYPLMIADGYLYSGGHHFVTKTTVKDGMLVAEEEAYETFDADGNATYYYGKEKVADDTNLTRLFEEYFAGEIVEFSVEKQ